MYTVSDDFHAACAAERRRIAVKAFVNSGVWIDGSSISSIDFAESVGTSDGATIGGTYAAEMTVKLYVNNEILPLANARIEPYVGVFVNDEPEYVPLGCFFAREVSSRDEYRTAELVCYDRMLGLEESYRPAISFPALPAAVMADIADQYGFEMADDYDYPQVEIGAVECTARQMVGYIAGLLGCNARFNRDGRLEFIWYADCDAVQITRDVQWSGALEQDGTEEFIIGAITTGTSENTISIGSGNVITFENPCITEEIAQDIYDRIYGTGYTPASVKWRGDPAVTAGDILAVETKSGEYVTMWVMEQCFRITGGMNVQSSCYASDSRDTTVNLSPIEQKISAAKRLLEEAIAMQSALINGARGGIFRITDSDGDMINDGFILAQSADRDFHGKCVVGNFEGIGLSQDGGQTYTQAITHDGINATAITTGQMNAERIAVHGNDPLTDFFKVEPFTDADGTEKISVVISAGDSDIILRQVNNKIGFFDRSGKALMYMTNSVFDLENLERFRIGDCKITKRASGNHTFDFSHT